MFADRIEAGRLLAKELTQYQQAPDTVVLALPRGGVPVAFEICQQLQLPLDVFLVRKLGTPGQEELAMGAIAEEGITIFNDEIIQSLGIDKELIDQAIKQQQEIIDERAIRYRQKRKALPLENKTVILVDDGIATGATMKAAIMAIRKRSCARLVVAVPVAPPDTLTEIQPMVDDLICLQAPEMFFAIGNWYQDFSQTSDDEVCDLLIQAARFNHNNSKKPRHDDHEQ